MNNNNKNIVFIISLEGHEMIAVDRMFEVGADGSNGVQVPVGWLEAGGGRRMSGEG